MCFPLLSLSIPAYPTHLMVSQRIVPQTKGPWNGNGAASGRAGASGRGGVDVVAEPELEDEQGPELVGVVAAPLDVLVDQGGDRLGAEQAAGRRDGVEQDRAELVLQL